jgi:CxxH/CxxC protein (TIGR04129 family)
MYVVCEVHLELALDRFVDEFEDAPDVVDLASTTFTAWEAPATCAECDREARFLVV